jgi:hypothetical protein
MADKNFCEWGVLMYRNTLVLFVAILSAVLTVFCAEGIAQDASRKESLSEFIVKSAEKIDVFLPTVWTKQGKSVRDKDGKPLDGRSLKWRYRYELTYEKYVPIHEFKERIGQATVKEIQDCIEKLDKMSAKEKALTLTAFFIYERIHRPFCSEKGVFIFPEQVGVDSVYSLFLTSYPKLSIQEQIPPTLWKSLVAAMEVHKGNKEIAFPAIEADKEEWHKQYRAASEKLTKLAGPTIKGPPGIPYVNRAIQASKDEQSADEVATLWEYLRFVSKSGTLESRTSRGPKSGNCSSEPKTLGGIATELLKSRYNHDDVPIDGVLWK